MEAQKLQKSGFWPGPLLKPLRQARARLLRHAAVHARLSQTPVLKLKGEAFREP